MPVNTSAKNPDEILGIEDMDQETAP